LKHLKLGEENTESPILEIKHLTKVFGGLTAVKDFSMSLKRGELKGLIGPNGAGKTTIFNLISGYYRPTSGSIIFKGEDITKQFPDKRVNQGIARTFQQIKMGESTTVLDEIKMAFFKEMEYTFLDIFFQTQRFITEEARIESQALDLLELLGIKTLSCEFSRDLPFGLLRKVSIARALALKPQILLLDEPTSGLNPSETKELVELICRIQQTFSLTIVLIEHDMSVIMEICGDIIAINYGEVIGTGNAQEIQNNPEVIKAYLGGIDEYSA